MYACLHRHISVYTTVHLEKPFYACNQHCTPLYTTVNCIQKFTHVHVCTIIHLYSTLVCTTILVSSTIQVYDSIQVYDTIQVNSIITVYTTIQVCSTMHKQPSQQDYHSCLISMESKASVVQYLEQAVRKLLAVSPATQLWMAGTHHCCRLVCLILQPHTVKEEFLCSCTCNG